MRVTRHDASGGLDAPQLGQLGRLRRYVIVRAFTTVSNSNNSQLTDPDAVPGSGTNQQCAADEIHGWKTKK